VPGAKQILEQSMAAYGGWDRWKKIRELVVTNRAWGWALSLRGKPRIFSKYRTLKLFPEQPYLTIDPYPREDLSGGFVGNKVWIENQGGVVLQERSNPRGYFASIRRKFFWDDLDALYFGSYAMWNYLTQPFLLNRPEITLQKLEPWSEQGETWQRLEASFPEDFPTHSPKQNFYFNEQGRIVRHDYTALVFGTWAKAAHYSMEFKTFDGFLFPTQRRVWPRRGNNRPFRGFTLVGLHIKDVKVF